MCFCQNTTELLKYILHKFTQIRNPYQILSASSFLSERSVFAANETTLCVCAWDLHYPLV